LSCSRTCRPSSRFLGNTPNETHKLNDHILRRNEAIHLPDAHAKSSLSPFIVPRSSMANQLSVVRYTVGRESSFVKSKSLSLLRCSSCHYHEEKTNRRFQVSQSIDQDCVTNVAAKARNAELVVFEQPTLSRRSGKQPERDQAVCSGSRRALERVLSCSL